MKLSQLADKPLNKKIKFSDSESSSSDDDNEDEGDEEEEEVPEEEGKSKSHTEQNDPSNENETTEKVDPHQGDAVVTENQTEEKSNDNESDVKCHEVSSNEVEEPPSKKHCIEADTSKNVVQEKAKSIDQLIEAELEELGDKNKVSDKISMLRLLFLFIIFIIFRLFISWTSIYACMIHGKLFCIDFSSLENCSLGNFECVF